nr:PhoD-like phosphatase N-terminal domain-containing protein [Brachybacterium phenoliresistens]
MTLLRSTSRPTDRIVVPRRAFLALAGASAGGAALVPSPSASADPSGPFVPPGEMFTLGVASGDPHPDGVVLWTRLAPDPVAADGLGGMPDRDVNVAWEMPRTRASPGSCAAASSAPAPRRPTASMPR